MSLNPTLYLCGPVTGHEDEARGQFRKAEDLLKSCGYHVVNPLKLSTPGVSWYTAMRRSIGAMVECTGVALLEGWQGSRGATLEASTACKLDMPVAPLSEWVRGCKE